MPQQLQIDYLKFVIPSLKDPVDVNKTFRDYGDSIMSSSVSSDESQPTVIDSRHINSILIYNTTSLLEVTIKPGLPKGSQFSIFCNSGEVKVSPAANATEIILPINSIKAQKVATFTKIREGSDSMWLMTVGG